uniref:Uncharacterized protein n=1 Tax=Knipowitschia caucasica TaxID=637954 RepID=A0AAV2JFA6_KNICA
MLPLGGGGANNSPLWPQVKIEPHDGDDGQGSSHHHSVLGGDVFEEGGPMSTMSESAGAMAASPGGAASEASYGSQSPDSLMGPSPVFNQRPRKRRKM